MTVHQRADASPIGPHGGALVDRRLSRHQAEVACGRARQMPRIVLGPVAKSDLELIGNGAFSPLRGFMGETDYRSVVQQMRLSSGLLWPMPITLPVPMSTAEGLSIGSEVALVDDAGAVLGILELAEKFRPDREYEAREVFRTTDPAHPGVARILAGGDTYLGGEVSLLDAAAGARFADHRRAPAETRAIFSDRGWRRVVGFQTRNPIHRAHEYLTKVALETVDGLLIHPLVGETKGDDVPADVRLRAYESLLTTYYPADRAVLSVYPAAMRYGGPREAVFHAIARKNYGCTHFIVGRDHAGVGSYYGSYDAQRIFDTIDPQELGITPLFFEHTFYCRACGAMASYKTCPHGADEHLILSGTAVRAMLAAGETPPPEFTRPEVARILIEAYRSPDPSTHGSRVSRR